MDNENILLSLELDYNKIQSQLNNVGAIIDKKTKGLKINLDIDFDKRKLDKIRNDIQKSLAIDLNLHGPQSQQMPKLNNTYLQNILERTTQPALFTGNQQQLGIDKYTEAIKESSKEIKELAKTVKALTRHATQETRQQRSWVSDLFGHGGPRIGMTTPGQVAGGALSRGAGALLRGAFGSGATAGAAGLGAVGAMGLMAGSGLAAAGGMAAYGLYRSYNQMMEEQPSRLDLLSRLGRQGYERIARPGGALYSTGLGYDINQQLQMAGNLAGQYGGQDLASVMQTMMTGERLFGVGRDQTTALAGAAFRQGGTAQDIRAVFENAITVGMDKAKLTVILPQTIRASMSLSEQMFAGIGKSTLDEMSRLLTGIYEASGSQLMQPERAAELLGTASERFRSMSMGGGDLATRALMMRALESERESAGGRMPAVNMAEFKWRTEQGIGANAENLTTFARQAAMEYGGVKGAWGMNPEQMGENINKIFKRTKGGGFERPSEYIGFTTAMQQVLGGTSLQIEKLMKGLFPSGEEAKMAAKMTPEERKKKYEEEVKKYKKELMERTPEGRLLLSQTDLTNALSKTGQGFTEIGTKLNETMKGGINALNKLVRHFMPEEQQRFQREEDIRESRQKLRDKDINTPEKLKEELEKRTEKMTWMAGRGGERFAVKEKARVNELIKNVPISGGETIDLTAPASWPQGIKPEDVESKTESSEVLAVLREMIKAIQDGHRIYDTGSKNITDALKDKKQETTSDRISRQYFPNSATRLFAN